LLHATLKVVSEKEFPLHLRCIYGQLGEIIDTYAPIEAAIERMSMAKNADSALKLAQVPRNARGEAEAALQQLGYKPTETARLAAEAAEGDDAAAIIHKALRTALGR
jgi:crossover junction endodeoxyribonuclease RuvC